MKLSEKELDDFETIEVRLFQGGLHSTYSNAASIEISAPPEVVCQSYVDYTWKLGGGLGMPTVCREGRSDGQGLIRCPGYGLLEMITRVEKGKIVEYSIPRGLPLTSHMGVVNFEPIGNGSTTKVTWVVHYTPKWYGIWFGAYCEKVLFPFFLRNLKAEVEKTRS